MVVLLKDIIDNRRTDKNTDHSYLDTYQSLFEPIQHNINNILEIGTHVGGSIKMWNDFFVNSTIYATDILPCLSAKEYLKNSPRVNLLLEKNAYSADFIESISDKKFNVILDDGSHRLEDVIYLVENYPKLLDPNGGMLVIEDIQDINWVEILGDKTPENLRQYIKIYDLRHNKNRYDDIIFTIQLPFGDANSI
jgi:hypothetical protein